MPKGQKVLSVRVDADDYSFLSRLAAEQREDVSKALRDLMGRGRVLLAVQRYRAGRASLGKAARLAGLSIAEMMDVLADYGVPAKLSVEDYRSSLESLAKVW